MCDRCWSGLEVCPDRTALLVYDDLTRRIVLAAKNGGRRDLWRPLGRALAQRVDCFERKEVDVVTWVPASRNQKRDRGFDQGHLLARSVARSLGVRHQRLLRRLDHRTQTGRSREQRLIGPRLRARGSDHGRVLVVDDVRTTGASLEAARAALYVCGNSNVTTLALAVVVEPTERAT